MKRPVQVLVVEDSVVQRKVLRQALEGARGLEVIGHASNGRLALSRLELGDVDVMTLDLEMPVMGGLEVLEELRGRQPVVGAIVVSALSQQGARQTLKAMRLGAFDLVCKPSSGEDFETVLANLRRDLVPLLLACGEFVRKQREASASGAPPSRGAARDRAAGTPSTAASRPPIRTPLAAPRAALPSVPATAGPSPVAGAGGSPARGSSLSPEVIVLGSSTGGPQALDTVLPALPAGLAAPLLVVQHMPPMFTRTLAESLDRKCALKVSEAEHGKVVLPGEAVIAPGGQQMKFRREIGGALRIVITDDEPERSCKPSVDYLFRCASEVMAERTLAVILTGMGDDGTAGIRLLKPRGARVIAQDEDSCVVFGMPKLPVVEGLVDAVLPLDRIADEIAYRCSGGVRA